MKGRGGEPRCHFLLSLCPQVTPLRIEIEGRVGENGTMAEGTTPMMRQYQGLRGQIPQDTLLFFRLGDFYEMFFEDAQEGARLLHLTLTKRNGIPMCGLPFHAAEGYVTKLLAAGRKVALCDQVGEVRTGQMVERAITRILSPGCAVGVELSEPKMPRWLAAVSRGTERKISGDSPCSMPRRAIFA